MGGQSGFDREGIPEGVPASVEVGGSEGGDGEVTGLGPVLAGAFQALVVGKFGCGPCRWRRREVLRELHEYSRCHLISCCHDQRPTQDEVSKSVSSEFTEMWIRVIETPICDRYQPHKKQCSPLPRFATMNFRHLKPQLIRFLDGDDEEGQTHWPKYRSLGTYARRNRGVFSEREYSRLKRVHVGVEGLAVTLIQNLHDVKETSLVREFPELANQGPDEWVDELTEFSDGKKLRRHDYLRGVSWREWALLHALRDDDGESESFCRNEEQTISA